MSDNGWKYIDTDDTWHFFMHGMSLCHEWITINPSNKEHKDEDELNCKKCVKLRKYVKEISNDNKTKGIKKHRAG
jgi:hypothetical protein